MTQRPPVLDDLSVVIPTLGRPILARSLAVIEAGTHWPAALVVVDQGRDAATATLLNLATQRGLPIKHVLSDQCGRARGVNRGIGWQGADRGDFAEAARPATATLELRHPVGREHGGGPETAHGSGNV